MSRRLLLVDSDIFILLSAAGMLEKMANLLGLPLSDVRRLDALPHQLQRGRRFLQKYSEDATKQALSDCKKVPSIEERPADVDLEELKDIEDIEFGDAVLLALTAGHPAYLLASGDKRALRAVGRSPGLARLRGQLTGRIICLERALAMLAEELGLAHVARAFTPLAEANATLRIIFTAGEATAQAHFDQAIASHLHDLEKDVGPDFLIRCEGGGHNRPK